MKQKLKLFTIPFLVFISQFLFPTVAFAATAEEYRKEYPTLNWIASMYEGVFGSGGMMDGLIDTLAGKEGIFASGGFDTIMSHLQVFTDVSVAVGILLTIIYFGYDFITEKIGSGQDLTPEIILKSFAKLFIVILIVGNITTFTAGIFEISNSVFAQVSGLASESEASMQIQAMIDEYVVDIGTKVDEANKIPMVGSVAGIGIIAGEFIGNIMMLLAYLISLVCQFMILFTIYSRQADLIARSIFAPMAIGDLYLGGARSRGFDYLKSYIGICFQAVVIIAMLYITNEIVAALIKPDDIIGAATKISEIPFSKTCTVVLAKFVQAIMILKSGAFAKELLGSH